MAAADKAEEERQERVKQLTGQGSCTCDLEALLSAICNALCHVCALIISRKLVLAAVERSEAAHVYIVGQQQNARRSKAQVEQAGGQLADCAMRLSVANCGSILQPCGLKLLLIFLMPLHSEASGRKGEKFRALKAQEASRKSAGKGGNGAVSSGGTFPRLLTLLV